MTSWLEKGRPAIFKALEEVCQRVDSDLIDELHERDKQRHVFLTQEVERLRPKAAIVDRLEQESRTLRDELAALRSQTRAATAEPAADELAKDSVLGGRLGTLDSLEVQTPTRQPLGRISVNTLNRRTNVKLDSENDPASGDQAAELKEIQKKYAHLMTKHKTLKDAYEQAKEKAREFKSSRDSYVEYSHKLESKIQKLQQRLGQRSVLQATFTASPQPQPPPRAEVYEVAKAREERPGTHTLHLPAPPPPKPNVSPRVEASRSFSALEKGSDTDTDLDRRRTASSPPEILAVDVAEQPGDSTEDQDEDTDDGHQLPPLPSMYISAPPGAVVKAEPSSDGVEVVRERTVPKRKRSNNNPNVSDAPTPRRVKTEHGSSDPLVAGETTRFSPHESLDLDIDATVMLTPRKSRAYPPRSPDDGDRHAALDSSQPHTTLDLDLQRASRSSSADLDPAPARVPPVWSFATYASPIRRPGLKTPGTTGTVKRIGPKLDQAVASLAEDGLSPVHINREAPTDSRSSVAGSRASRLDELLNGRNPLPQGEPVLLRPTRQSREVAPSSTWLTETPTRILPFGKVDGEEKPQSPITKPRQLALAGAQGTPGDLAHLRAAERPRKPKEKRRPVRDQPLESLGIDDFRVNPKFNNGQNYAFTEVVRDQAQRAGLPGCTDPDCCGKHFRGMAQAELEAAGPSLIYRPASIKLLEDYLGDQMYRLGSMSLQKKEELWLEARTGELANKHGKHRHRYARQQSPPGFWNTDFPTTQENEQDKEEAEKRERRMVEERWKDAMRGEGRWLFRDE